MKTTRQSIEQQLVRLRKKRGRGGIYESAEKALEEQQAWVKENPGKRPFDRFKHDPDLDVYWDTDEYRINQATKRLEAL